MGKRKMNHAFWRYPHVDQSGIRAQIGYTRTPLVKETGRRVGQEMVCCMTQGKTGSETLIIGNRPIQIPDRKNSSIISEKSLSFVIVAKGPNRVSYIKRTEQSGCSKLCQRRSFRPGYQAIGAWRTLASCIGSLVSPGWVDRGEV